MDWLYHDMPIGMTGTTIYPLNDLEGRLPHAYRRQMAKYRNRDHIARSTIPLLGCTWGDAVFLSAVHPDDIRDTLRLAGFRPHPWRAYRIDPARLDPAKMAVMRSWIGRPSIYEPYDAKKLHEYAELHQDVELGYLICRNYNHEPLTYQFVTQVFHAGPIDISGCEIVVAA